MKKDFHDKRFDESTQKRSKNCNGNKIMSDQLVYKLYNLTEEEIAIMEGRG